MEHDDVAIVGDVIPYPDHFSTPSAACIDLAVPASSRVLFNYGNMSNLQASNLFSVQGRVVVITGGGSGMSCPTMEKKPGIPTLLDQTVLT